MVPSAFVVLKELPLTPNGKIDRKALPPPQWQSQSQPTSTDDASTLPAALMSPAEQRVAAAWCELLGVPRVGLHDNFFAAEGAQR